MDKSYFEILRERAKKSKVYTPYQMTGLLLAEVLEDEGHKSLYIKLAKKYDHELLLQLAKSVADRENVKNKGAYFMKVLHEKDFGGKQQGRGKVSP